MPFRADYSKAFDIFVLPEDSHDAWHVLPQFSLLYHNKYLPFHFYPL